MLRTENPDFDVVVEVAGAGHNRYAYDAKARAVRLVGVASAEQACPVDLGAIARTLSQDGLPLRTMLVVRRPTFPGCVVAARPVGLLEVQDGEGTEQRVLAVPVADASFATVKDLGDLPAARLKEIEAFVREQETQDISLSWRSADAARRVVVEALQAARLAQAEAGRSTAPRQAWQAVAGLGTAGQSALEADASTEAERQVYQLPYRFQKYVAECLAPEERILLHILRPPLSYGRLPFLRRHANDAILVATDRQVLFLADVLPPDSTYVDWGYVARTAAVERLTRVAITRTSPYPRLELEVEAGRGTERLAFDFPAEAVPALERAAALLEGFMPKAQGHYLRRRPHIAKELPSLDREEELIDMGLVAKLEERLKEHLAEGEPALARALAPAWPAKQLGPRLVAVTERRVLILPESGAPLDAFALEAISTLELRHSLLGCHLAIAVPARDAVERAVLDFDFPTAGQFVRLFRAARQLLSTPAERAVGGARGNG